MKSKSPKSDEKELRLTAARVLKEFMADVEAVGIEKVGGMARPGYHLLQSPTSCSTPKGKSKMTIKQAAQSALDVQNACNPSGVIHSLAEIVKDVLWPEAIRLGKGSRWVGQHPIVTMYLLKLSEMNGCGSTLHESYEPAEKACQELGRALSIL